jgi:hypothetical protein
VRGLFAIRGYAALSIPVSTISWPFHAGFIDSLGIPRHGRGIAQGGAQHGSS